MFLVSLVAVKSLEMSRGTDFLAGVQPRLCSRHRNEASKTSAKNEVGAILCRRHSNNSVEKQNRETSFAARFFKPQ